MLIRSLAAAAALACLTGLLFAAQSSTIGPSDAPGFSLVGLAGLGFLTLRSEGHRQASPMQSTTL